MLLLTGVGRSGGKRKPMSTSFLSEDEELAVWAGVIDDLWKLGKPVGKGGPWANTAVEGRRTLLIPICLPFMTKGNWNFSMTAVKKLPSPFNLNP